MANQSEVELLKMFFFADFSTSYAPDVLFIFIRINC